MDGFSKKEYLSLKMPTAETAISDHRRISLALETLGYGQVHVPLPILRKLYPMCRESEFDNLSTIASAGGGMGGMM